MEYEVIAVLKEGSTECEHNYYYDRETIKRICSKCGRLEKIRTINYNSIYLKFYGDKTNKVGD